MLSLILQLVLYAPSVLIFAVILYVMMSNSQTMNDLKISHTMKMFSFV